MNQQNPAGAKESPLRRVGKLTVGLICLLALGFGLGKLFESAPPKPGFPWKRVSGEISFPGKTGKTDHEMIDKAVVLIERTHDALKAKEIDLLLVVVPIRERIYPEMFYNSSRPPKYIQRRYQDLLSKLSAKNVCAVDLETLFLEKKSPSGSNPLYNSHDHHWTQRGCELACELITSKLRALHPQWCDQYPELRIDLEPTQVNYTVNDDRKPFTRSMRFASPFLLGGDSFSAWMPPFLEHQLHAPIWTSCVLGGQGHGSIKKLIHDQAFKGKRSRVLIWEFWEAAVFEDNLGNLEPFIPQIK